MVDSHATPSIDLLLDFLKHKGFFAMLKHKRFSLDEINSFSSSPSDLSLLGKDGMYDDPSLARVSKGPSLDRFVDGDGIVKPSVEAFSWPSMDGIAPNYYGTLSVHLVQTLLLESSRHGRAIPSRVR
jgi:hypothetical protein